MRALGTALAVLLGLALASLPFLHYRLGAVHHRHDEAATVGRGHHPR
jgi:hypothetical protein